GGGGGELRSEGRGAGRTTARPVYKATRVAGAAAVRRSFALAAAPKLSVTTRGQRRQASTPSWSHQRQASRIAQSGGSITTAGRRCTIRVARRQSLPSKW